MLDNLSKLPGSGDVTVVEIDIAGVEVNTDIRVIDPLHRFERDISVVRQIEMRLQTDLDPERCGVFTDSPQPFIDDISIVVAGMGTGKE